MKEIVIKGVITHDEVYDTWFLCTKDRDFMGDVPEAIDQLIDVGHEDITCNNEHVEVIVRLLDR